MVKLTIHNQHSPLPIQYWQGIVFVANECPPGGTCMSVPILPKFRHDRHTMVLFADQKMVRDIEKVGGISYCNLERVT